MAITPTPMKALLKKGLADFKRALVDRNMYDQDHQNLDRAYNGAKDFVQFLLEGKAGLVPRPQRRAKRTSN